MRLSISVIKTDDGYLPRLVLQTPKGFRIIPADQTCSTWKEAWMVSSLIREKLRSQKAL